MADYYLIKYYNLLIIPVEAPAADVGVTVSPATLPTQTI